MRRNTPAAPTLTLQEMAPTIGDKVRCPDGQVRRVVSIHSEPAGEGRQWSVGVENADGSGYHTFREGDADVVELTEAVPLSWRLPRNEPRTLRA